MMISCPACETRYDVPDAAIGLNGRRLKCAQCGHRWHIDPPAAATPSAPAPEIPDEPAAPPTPPVAAAPPLPVAPSLPLDFDPAPSPVAAVPPDMPGAFDYAPPFVPPPGRRRGWLVWALVALALLAGAVVAVLALVPAGSRTLGLADNGSPLVISFVGTPVRRAMDSGNELLAVAGRVTNPTDTAQRVPEIKAQLRDAQGRTVYDWTIGPPVTRLAPGASAEFNAAEVDVPAAARTVHLRTGALPRV